MADFLALIYELFYDVRFSEIFKVFYLDGGFVNLGLLFILLPLLGMFIFYILLKNPYYKLRAWLICLAIITIVVLFSSYFISRSSIILSPDPLLQECLNRTTSGYQEFAYRLFVKIALLNFFMSMILSFIYSVILKRFSKIHMHLPI